MNSIELEGWNAAVAGKFLDDNPYQENDSYYHLWRYGFILYITSTWN